MDLSHCSKIRHTKMMKYNVTVLWTALLILLYSTLSSCTTVSSLATTTTTKYGTPKNVTYDDIAITINGKRTLLISGSVHFPRTTPDMWSDILKKSVQAGINTISTYTFWGLHEQQPGSFNFTGNLDLLRFLDLTEQYGLHVLLRIGPYGCGEINYGAFPEWLREVPGVQFRTYNEPYLKYAKRWMDHVLDLVRPRLASNGGNIILVQIENEYGDVIGYHGELGEKYLKWCMEYAKSADTKVPWIMCKGSTAGALETLNSMYPHQQLSSFWKQFPHYPAIVTEEYPGWYNNWGYAYNKRKAVDLAYSVARFFAAGGSGLNYYMWFGGTTFARDSSYLLTTTYDFDAPIDEYGHKMQPKYDHLSKLHYIIQDYAKELLAGNDRPVPTTVGTSQFVYTFGTGARKMTFLCNDATSDWTGTYNGINYTMKSMSVILLNPDGDIMFDTSHTRETTKRTMNPYAKELKFEYWTEPKPGTSQHAPVRTTMTPPEQLSLTHDLTDYAFYTRKIKLARRHKPAIFYLDAVGDVAHLFVDGEYVNSTNLNIEEIRGHYNGTGYAQAITITSGLSSGEHELTFMTVAIGLTKHEGQVGGDNLAMEKKGLWGDITLNGDVITYGNWTTQAGLIGEGLKIFTEHGMKKVDWNSLKNPMYSVTMQRTWWKTTFHHDSNHPAPVTVDFSGMTKGIAWVNGHCIGRYVIIPATRRFGPLQPVDFGQPTQIYYNLPRHWLRHGENHLVFFEELGGNLESVTINHVEYSTEE
jgi:beta-galactosidase